ncbi:MAG: protein kinase domain-containing protein [Bradymonadaceae bacterium]
MIAESLGKYTLVRHIATGGMAEIWLAEQTGPGGFNKELVIKRILPHLAKDTHFTQMFLDEARIVAHLTHPNIGQVYELGEVDGSYFIAMEFIDGVDLSALQEKAIESGLPVPVEICTRIIRDVLIALDYAHDFSDKDGNHVGLIHRDISPQNVLVSNDGIVKLVDFGVAKAALNESKTEAGAVKGKFAYMAPEQIQNQVLDRRADLFGVGILFYELLTGVKPFGDELAAVSQILSADPADPRTHRGDVPEVLVQIIGQALAKDREQRFESADAMVAALEGFLQEQNSFVTPRDLSVYVRQLRGLPMPKTTTQLAARTPKPGPVTFAERVEPRQVTTEPMQASGYHPIPDQGSSRGKTALLMVGFLVLMVLILGAFGVVGYLVIGQNTGEEPAEVVAQPAKAPAKTAAKKKAASGLHHVDGLVVFISSNPEPADVYYQGRKIGSTPYQTNLRPGTYELEFRAGAKSRTRPVSVEQGRPIQRFRVDL